MQKKIQTEKKPIHLESRVHQVNTLCVSVVAGYIYITRTDCYNCCNLC